MTVQAALEVEQPRHWLKDRFFSLRQPRRALPTRSRAVPEYPVIDPSRISRTGTVEDRKLISLIIPPFAKPDILR
jgi:hypothetical protein